MTKDAFCKKHILRQVYYMTRHFMVAYDIEPVLPGHSLIIPKRHVLDVTQLTESEFSEIYRIISKVKPVLLKRYDADSYDITMQIGKHSGRTVPHLHIHIIPRSNVDPYQIKNNKMYENLEKMGLSKDVKNEVIALRKVFNCKLTVL